MYFTEVTGIELVVLHDMKYLKTLSMLCSFFIALLAHFVIKKPGRILLLVRSKTIWFISSMTAYFIGISGTIYCIIRNPPAWFDGNGNDLLTIFTSMGREQWKYEGLVTAFFQFMFALLVYLMMSVTRRKMNPILSTLSVCLCLTGIMYCSREFMALYELKTPWYSLQEVVPKTALNLISRGNVKKRSGIAARLLRMSEIWLFEYTGKEAFVKKFKVIVIDFLLRSFGIKKFGK
mmetsp:Transcript_3095/g.4730  ORF Transcript_3095/g.4730 Transcript_3095/m.4730 type:complete len:234 (+) Transcript_3095:228-929(+)